MRVLVSHLQRAQRSTAAAASDSAPFVVFNNSFSPSGSLCRGSTYHGPARRDGAVLAYFFYELPFGK